MPFKVPVARDFFYFLDPGDQGRINFCVLILQTTVNVFTKQTKAR